MMNLKATHKFIRLIIGYCKNLPSTRGIAIGNLVGICVFSLFISPPSFAIDSISGFKLGQSCVGNKFSKKQSSITNPDDVLDEIIFSRNQHASTTSEGYFLSVSCNILNNQISHISLTSKKLDDIILLKDSLREMIGRQPDDSKEQHIRAQSLAGIRVDGKKVELEIWNFPGDRKAVAYTFTVEPYGTNSILQLKYEGGIEIYEDGVGEKEWKYLIKSGVLSSKKKEEQFERQRKDSTKNLLR